MHFVASSEYESAIASYTAAESTYPTLGKSLKA